MKLYLDTSVFSAYHDPRVLIRQGETKTFWKTLEDYDGFTSELAIKELTAVSDAELRKKLLLLTKDFIILKINKETRELADRYVQAGIIPKKYTEDALHLAVASVNGIDILVSWNFEHMVKRKTRLEVNLANSLNGYRAIEILAPPEL